MTADDRDAIAARALRHLHAEGALRTVDAAFAALLRERLHASPPVALAGALAMRAVALGHSSFALADAPALLAALDVQATLPDTDAWVEALRTSPQVEVDGDATVDTTAAEGTLLSFAHGRIALRRYSRYEQRLADRLAQRATSTTDDAALPSLAAALHALFPATVEDDGPDRQALAAIVALRRRLLLITGGPGTGKTTTVARLLALRLADARLRGLPVPRIALAAPTGRAAARLGEAIDAVLRADVDAGRLDAVIADAVPRRAGTLHRLLGARPGRVGFRHDARHPLPVDLVVVDEASMIDLPLMAKLVDAVPDDATLVLLGDPDQLPAVEAGDVLGGLCVAAGDGLAFPPRDAVFASVLLGTDVPTTSAVAPLAGTRVQLVRGWRQAGAAGLRALADAVQRGDADTALAVLDSEEASLDWHQGDTLALAGTLRREALPAFMAVRDADDPAQALQRATTLRLLTALRRGPFGAEYWNAWCATELGGRTPYFHGRLLAMSANSERHGLFNGDLGVAWRDAQGEIAVWFDTANGLRAWRPAQLPAHASAWATTVHKAQGSEFARIALILPDADARVLSRELLYTALTRARERALLWASPDLLRRSIDRRTWRDSGLAARLQARVRPVE
jgi:exodeoxyribonuclease V alpha subunit